MTDPGATPALLLDRVAYRDRDWILTLLTRDLGLVGAIARSARGSRHRFAGALDLFVVFSARLSTRPHASLAGLVETEVLRQFPGVLERLDRLEAGQALLALARDLLRDAPATAATFDHVVATLERLERAPAGGAHGVLLAGCLALLGDVGHAPATGACPACGRDYEAAGGAVLAADAVLACARCAPPGAGLPVAAGVLAIGRGARDAGPDDRDAVLGFVAALVGGVLGRPWRLPVL